MKGGGRRGGSMPWNSHSLSPQRQQVLKESLKAPVTSCGARYERPQFPFPCLPFAHEREHTHPHTLLATHSRVRSVYRGPLSHTPPTVHTPRQRHQPQTRASSPEHAPLPARASLPLKRDEQRDRDLSKPLYRRGNFPPGKNHLSLSAPPLTL